MRASLVVAAVLAAILWRAPASLVDLAARRAGAGEVRVSASEGTLWGGQGTVEVIDRPTQAWQSWRRIQWTFEPAALLRARVGWRVLSGGVPMARLEASPSGWAIVQLDVSGPARLFWQRIPHELGKFGWAGDLTLTSPGIECTWDGRCSGRLEARWLNAASDFLPNRPLGDYALEARGDAGDILLNWHTLRGDIRVEGDGRLSARGGVSLKGAIAGDPVLLQHLTAVAGPWVKPTGGPGRWSFDFNSAASRTAGSGRASQ